MADATPVTLQDAGAVTQTVSAGGHSILLSQDPSSRNHGLVVWDAAEVLARYLLEGRKRRTVSGVRARMACGCDCTSQMAGRCVVELGAGTGAGGLLLSKAGANVVLTDLASVVPLLRRNCDSTTGVLGVSGDGDESGAVAVCEWDFSTPVPAGVREFIASHREGGARYPDFVIGSDVCYAEGLIDPLLSSIDEVIGPSSVAVLANERRCELTYEAFVKACGERFQCKLVPRKFMPETSPETLFIVELRRKRA
jgi:protein N-lysine methyltransferase METTL21D